MEAFKGNLSHWLSTVYQMGKAYLHILHSLFEISTKNAPKDHKFFPLITSITALWCLCCKAQTSGSRCFQCSTARPLVRCFAPFRERVFVEPGSQREAKPAATRKLFCEPFFFQFGQNRPFCGLRGEGRGVSGLGRFHFTAFPCKQGSQ